MASSKKTREEKEEKSKAKETKLKKQENKKAKTSLKKPNNKEKKGIGIGNGKVREPEDEVIIITSSSTDSQEESDNEQKKRRLETANERKKSKNPKKRTKKQEELDDDDDDEDKVDTKVCNFPMTRIKRIIKSQSSDFLMAGDAVFLVNKATDKFLEQFSEDAYACCSKDRKKSVAYKHLVSVVSKWRRYDFLSDFVPEKIKAENALAERKLAEAGDG